MIGDSLAGERVVSTDGEYIGHVWFSGYTQHWLAWNPRRSILDMVISDRREDAINGLQSQMEASK